MITLKNSRQEYHLVANYWFKTLEYILITSSFAALGQTIEIYYVSAFLKLIAFISYNLIFFTISDFLFSIVEDISSTSKWLIGVIAYFLLGLITIIIIIALFEILNFGKI